MTIYEAQMLPSMLRDEFGNWGPSDMFAWSLGLHSTLDKAVAAARADAGVDLDWVADGDNQVADVKVGDIRDWKRYRIRPRQVD